MQDTSLESTITAPIQHAEARVGLLKGKYALIAGIANPKSIAWGIAQAFHAHGATLAFSCVDATRRRVTKLAAELGSDAVFVCDVRNEADVLRTIADVDVAFDGKLDVIIHAIAYASIDALGREFVDVDRNAWREALDVSAYSLVALARAARPLMKRRGGGSIITLSYTGGRRVSPHYGLMGIAKAALESAARYLAYDLGPDGIRVNVLLPGPIPTVSAAVIPTFEETARRLETHAPLLRPISAREVGEVAAWYSSDLCTAITGANVPVDGGLSILAASAGRHARASRDD